MFNFNDTKVHVHVYWYMSVYMYMYMYMYVCVWVWPSKRGLLDFWIWKRVVSWVHILYTHTPTHPHTTVVESLDKQRQPLGHLEAVYIMVPSDKVRIYMYVYMLHSLTHITHNVPISHVHKLTYHTFSHYTLTYHELLYHKFTYQLPIHHFKHISG